MTKELDAIAPAKKFIGDRLDQAMSVRECDSETLAKELNIPPILIKYWISGEKVPDPNIIEQIATLLDMPRAFFFKPTIKTNPDSAFYKMSRDERYYEPDPLAQIPSY